MPTLEETQQQLSQMQAMLAHVREQVAAMGLPVAGASNGTVPKCLPATPEEKLAARAKAAGGVWHPHPQVDSVYTAPCRNHNKRRPAALCSATPGCWTPEREHHEKFALGLCDCEPPPAEEPTPPASALTNGNVIADGVGSPQPRQVGPRRNRAD